MRRPLLVAAGIVGLLLGAALFVGIRAMRTRAAREALAARIREGMERRRAARGAEAPPAPPPGERNAAVLYWEAIVRLPVEKFTGERLEASASPGEAVALLARSRESLDLAVLAGAREECLFTGDQMHPRGAGPNAPGYLVALADRLRLRVRESLRAGRIGEAVEDGVALERMGGLFGRQHEFGDLILERAAPSLLAILRDPGLDAGAAGRLLAAMPTGTEVAASQRRTWAALDDRMDAWCLELLGPRGGSELSRWTTEPLYTEAGPKDWLAGSVILGPALAEDVERWRGLRTGLEAALAAEPRRRAEALAARIAEAAADPGRPGPTHSSAVLGNWISFHDRLLRGRLAQDALRVAAALRLHRLRGGGALSSPEALVPGILEEVPRDPFTGGPLLFRRREGGFLVYGAGFDGVDDGGDPARDWIGVDWVDPAGESPGGAR